MYGNKRKNKRHFEFYRRAEVTQAHSLFFDVITSFPYKFLHDTSDL